MLLHACDLWDEPFFKVLKRYDTAAQAGNIAGVSILKNIVE